MLHGSFIENSKLTRTPAMDGGFTQHWLTPSHSSHRPERFEVERHGRLTMATYAEILPRLTANQ